MIIALQAVLAGNAQSDHPRWRRCINHDLHRKAVVIACQSEIWACHAGYMSTVQLDNPTWVLLHASHD